MERAQQPRKLGRRVIDLLLHLPIPRYHDEVLRRDEDEPCGPDLHVDRILVALKLDLAAQRAEGAGVAIHRVQPRSEEHTSELQSHSDLVCRLLLEKKKNKPS